MHTMYMPYKCLIKIATLQEWNKTRKFVKVIAFHIEMHSYVFI